MTSPDLAVLAPGQGAQKPGVLAPWLRGEEPRALLADWSAAAGLDLADLGTRAPAEVLRRTEIAQPVLVASALLATARELPAHLRLIVAGHSVGELAAAAVAGALAPRDAVALAAARGRAMALACAEVESGMLAVLGGEPAAVLAGIEAAGLAVANRNGAGQIVAAGPASAVSALLAAPPAGSTARRLEVAGAFHTPFMEPARAAFAAAVGAVAFADPVHRLLGNADGAEITTGAQCAARLVDQLTAPVRWDLCQAAVVEAAPAGIVELPPAGVLSGLLRRTGGPRATALGRPGELTRAAARTAVPA
ncbi:hypothetical protein AXK57_07645 [Tsukamurella pulmonis]|uniref:ACP S-malonyltransferase n=1 Tax=Tsukamurella pulmonis TaxID=47312 RepID=UPI00079382F1|nr:ACP S-malonyltransferase [Tsukamurella pulmonis]KXP11222.1 hypothetical protein AXK57_07645 [Tsukamurella pulmonis]